MIGDAAFWAKQRGRPTVLGGLIPVDEHWLTLMHRSGMMPYIDIVGIHAFPGMWFPHHSNWEWQRDWQGWPAKLSHAAAHGGRPVWVTETGIATWDLALGRETKYELQAAAIDAIIAAPGERFYFYSLIDLDPDREAIEGFHVDENEYHMGLTKHGRTFTRRASCGSSHAYHASRSGVLASAQLMPVRSSVTPSVRRSSRTRSTWSWSPTRNHSSMPTCGPTCCELVVSRGRFARLFDRFFITSSCLRASCMIQIASPRRSSSARAASTPSSAA